MKRIRCIHCDNFIKLPKSLEAGYEYHCPRCENLVYRPGSSQSVITSLTLSAMVMFFFAFTTPLLSVYIIDDNSLSILDTLFFLFETDVFSGVLLFVTIIIIPFILNILTLLIIFYKELTIRLDFVKKLIAFYLIIKEWNMIEVYFIGLLIAMVKLYELSDVTLLMGFWINLFYLVLLYLSFVLFNPNDIVNINKRKKFNPHSLRISFVCILLALIFILPSNILPIMPTYKYGVEYPNTIFDGIYAFYEDGDIFVPFVIFFASVCIPFLKIVGISIMILMVKYNIFLSYKKFATKYYIVTDAFGKYSLLDVYVVVLAAAYIQYDKLVRIEIGEAIIPFALVVVFTMLASKSFDTRLLWKEKNDNPTTN